MDVLECNTVGCALNDLLKLIGLGPISRDEVDGIMSWRGQSKNEIYRWLVALLLGRNFTDIMVFDGSMAVEYRDSSANGADENTTQSNTHNALNSYIYLVLESERYPRLDKITLDDKQDPRELFLAVAFLVAKDKWFHKFDTYSDEVMKLKECMVEYACANVDLSDVTEAELDGVKQNPEKTEVGPRAVNGAKIGGLRGSNLRDARNNVTTAEKDAVGFAQKCEQFEECVVQVASDISAKATLLSRRKTVKSYDSELLRLIMGRSEYELEFLRAMDDTTSNETDLSQETFDPAECTGEFWEGAEDLGEWSKLVKDITKLSNVVVQLQFRLRDLSESIKKNDLERLKYFSKMTDEGKNYESRDDAEKGGFIGDRINQPSPVEFLLISDEALFRRHMGIMSVINRALDNEIRRSEFWTRAIETLFEVIIALARIVEPKVKPKSNGKAKKPGAKLTAFDNLLTIHCKPADIKFNAHVLKSFLVEGIPNENFARGTGSEKSETYNHVIDFLRKENVKFANFRAGEVADKHGRKTTFTAFINNEIHEAIERGTLKRKDYEDTKDSIAKFFKLFEDVDPDKARVTLPLMRKWILGHESFESEAKASDKGLSSSLINSISDSLTQEYDELEAENFSVVERIAWGKLGTEAAKAEPKAAKGGIADVVNYGYYFDLCEQDFRMSPQIELDCLDFSNRVDATVVAAVEAAEDTEKAATKGIKEVMAEILANSSIVISE